MSEDVFVCMNLSKFSETLNDLLADKNISQKELAENVNIDEACISRYLSGECEPALKNIVTLADYFNCSVDFLIGLEPEKNIKDFLKCPSLGTHLENLAHQAGYSVYKFSKLCSINDASYYYWVKGKHMPSIDQVIKISKFLNCSVDYVLGREN